MSSNQKYSNRKLVISISAICIILLYIIRLFTLQIMSDDYKRNADSNALVKKVQYPSRGLIYDRNNKLLVYNEPSYNITLINRELNDLDTLNFCRVMGVTPDFFKERLKKITDLHLNPGYSGYTPQIFLSHIPAQEFSVFQEKLFQFKGVDAERRSTRKYNYPFAAHILGDMGEVSRKDMKKDSYYRGGDYIGKLGVERSYEKQLRGEKGGKIMLRDVHGRLKGSYKEGKYDQLPIPGKNITLSIDIELQELAEKLLEGKRGAIVAIEPSTGEILCMASAPTYDPNILIGRDRGKNMQLLSHNKNHPLLNRAIMGQYPPGSTFKPTQGLTFLQEGIITPRTVFPCNHGFTYKGLHVGCHSHSSPINFVPALATSCNSFFCWGLYRMMSSRKNYSNVQEAMTRWKDYMVSMGYGYALGVDLPGERRGMIPNASYYDKAYRKRWNGLTIISISIGQGEVTATPLQIANLSATIANRGYFITPHVVHKIEHGTLDNLYIKKRYTMVDKMYYQYAVEGMREAVTNGTCRHAAIPDIKVCGKTGTAQNRGKDHSAFMGFAPMDKPRIAVSVYVENGGYGAVYGVPIGKLIMEKYLNDTLSVQSQQELETIRKKHIYYE